MWRYKTDYYNLDAYGSDGLNEYLSASGQDGWELIVMTPVGQSFFLVFKKKAS